MINNLDTLRSYGSAGDELEIAPDYGKNLNRSTPQGCISNHCDTEKLKWNASTIGDKPRLKTGKHFNSFAVSFIRLKSVRLDLRMSWSVHKM